MSLTHGLSKEMKKIIQGITEDPTDFEALSERIEIVGPELNYYLVRMRKAGLVEYDEMGSTVRLTEKGRQAAAGLRTEQAMPQLPS
jgi:Mn-dependent DtxR family transcriptional regulator